MTDKYNRPVIITVTASTLRANRGGELLLEVELSHPQILRLARDLLNAL